MDNYEELLNVILEKLNPASNNDSRIPVGISNRHIHLSQADLDKLFGVGYQLTKLKDLSQPGQFACKETVIICGPKGVISNVRILGPVRPETQVEILQSDTYRLGIPGVLRQSGNLYDTPGVTIVGLNGSTEIQHGVIVAQRHIHMLPEDAQRFGVQDGETVSIEFEGSRGGVLNNVIVRATKNSSLECHIDTEEANALGVIPGTKIKIKKN